LDIFNLAGQGAANTQRNNAWANMYVILCLSSCLLFWEEFALIHNKDAKSSLTSSVYIELCLNLKYPLNRRKCCRNCTNDL